MILPTEHFQPAGATSHRGATLVVVGEYPAWISVKAGSSSSFDMTASCGDTVGEWQPVESGCCAPRAVAATLTLGNNTTNSSVSRASTKTLSHSSRIMMACYSSVLGAISADTQRRANAAQICAGPSSPAEPWASTTHTTSATLAPFTSVCSSASSYALAAFPTGEGPQSHPCTPRPTISGRAMGTPGMTGKHEHLQRSRV